MLTFSDKGSVIEHHHSCQTAGSPRIAPGRENQSIAVMCMSGLIALLAVATGIVHTIQALNGTTTLYLPTNHSPAEFLSTAPATVTSGYFDGSFALNIEGVDSSGLAVYAWTMCLGFALAAVIFAFTFYLCLRLYRRQPFGRLMTRGFTALSIITIAVTLATPAVFAEAHVQIISSMGIDADQAPFNTEYAFGVVDIMSLACGIFLALIAGAFHAGSRLQRDNEGLV